MESQTAQKDEKKVNLSDPSFEDSNGEERGKLPETVEKERTERELSRRRTAGKERIEREPHRRRTTIVVDGNHLTLESIDSENVIAKMANPKKQ